MVFEFRVWGLFLLFILIVFSFWKKEKRDEKGNFSLMLICTYVLEMLYILCYIRDVYHSSGMILLKIYYMVFCGVFSLMVYYFLENMLDNKNNSNYKFAKVFCGILWFIPVIFISFLKNIDDMWTVVRCVAFISFLIHFISLNVIRKCHNRKNKILYGFAIIEVFLLIFEIQFPRVEVLESGVILLVIYLYVGLENRFIKENSVLKLEKDYAMKNLLDKQSFLRKLSHEMRIPLNSIEGFSEIMLEEESVDDMKEAAKDIRHASRELIHFVNSMIDLSMIESGNLEILEENYNIYDVLNDLENMVSYRFKETDINFNTSIEKDIPQVLLGDSDRISQIILNILSNSIKYTERGKINLNVSCVKSDSMCRLLFKITDTGKGMSKNDINHLFDNDDDNKGIGLKISYYLLKLMNGKIDIASEEGKGTIVSISIDQRIVSLVDDKKDTKKERIDFVSFKGKRVLLVDDNKLNLKVASKLLLPYEVEIVDANSGQECLDILDKDTNFDLILMDDLMPEMSGTETLNVLRKIERVSGYYIPTVALTANVTAGIKDKYLEYGFDEYLEKPIKRKELDRILKKYLNK